MIKVHSAPHRTPNIFSLTLSIPAPFDSLAKANTQYNAMSLRWAEICKY